MKNLPVSHTLVLLCSYPILIAPFVSEQDAITSPNPDRTKAPATTSTESTVEPVESDDERNSAEDILTMNVCILLCARDVCICFTHIMYDYMLTDYR